MEIDFRCWMGIGGVPPHDDPSAYLWERRLHWIMIGVALLSIPSFLFEATIQAGPLHQLGLSLDFVILAAFSAELLWMLKVTRYPQQYLLRNWLDLLIVIGAAVSLTGWQWEWIPLARLLRVAVVMLILVRFLGVLRNLFSPTAMPYVLGLGMVTMAVAGAGFYWLEPTVYTYGDGLWLAFTSAATVGYGDIVPTTTTARIFAVIMVLIGYAILSMVTASIAAFFIGEDEKHLRRETHHDIKALREEVAQLRAMLEEKERRESGSDK
ncbi:MAG TPA: potassium channel family protein [Sulfuricella sp.]|nr:potassium channel family protein [Sulfuricella sp.]